MDFLRVHDRAFKQCHVEREDTTEGCEGDVSRRK
jgi:hypothetical protein